MMGFFTQITGDLFNEILNNGLFDIISLTFILSAGFSIFIGIKNRLYN